MEQIADRISIYKKICNGKLTIRGTRITVQTLLEFLSEGNNPSEILKQYPSLDETDIQSALKFAAIQMEKNHSIH